jgi:hypothetical protein
MSIRDYYKDHYCLEASRRSDLTNALALPLGVLSLLIGGLVVVAQSIHVPLNPVAIAQTALMTVAGGFILLTAYFLARSYYNYDYGYTPSASSIKKFKDDLVAYYLACGDSDVVSVDKAENEALEHLDSQYAEHAHRNHQNNNKKSSYIHKANGSLIAATFSTLLVGVLFLYGSVSATPNIPTVRVVNFSEIKMPTPPNHQPSAPQPTTTQSPPTPIPQKPTPPPGTVLKEHVDPTKKR